jgi:hypothetical protein
VTAGVGARGATWRERLVVPLAVACLHFGYGTGMLREAGRRLLVGGRTLCTARAARTGGVGCRG